MTNDQHGHFEILTGRPYKQNINESETISKIGWRQFPALCNRSFFDDLALRVIRYSSVANSPSNVARMTTGATKKPHRNR